MMSLTLHHCADMGQKRRSSKRASTSKRSRIEDNVPSPSQSEAEELRPSINIEAEERRKRGEDFQLRFGVDGSREVFRKGLTKRKILGEKQLSLNGLKDKYPHILENIKTRRWENFTEPPTEYNETLVREFYASYGASRTKYHKRNKVFTDQVLVRGKTIFCNIEALNEFYVKGWRAGTTEYTEKFKNKENECGWIASVIAKGTPAWVDPQHKIYKEDLTREGRYWLSFVTSRLVPTQNETEIAIEKALLIACIMTGIKIDVGALIFQEIGIRAMQHATSLPFPCLITALCKAVKVPILPTDKTGKETRDIDITRIMDISRITIVADPS